MEGAKATSGEALNRAEAGAGPGVKIVSEDQRWAEQRYV